jgi:hypothetical protein
MWLREEGMERGGARQGCLVDEACREIDEELTYFEAEVNLQANEIYLR